MLLTIADLDQPASIVNADIERAKQLSQVYFDHIVSSQNEGYKYEVEVFGGNARASGIHASEVSNCMRAVVYSVMGTERKDNNQNVDVNMLMRFRIGHAVHAMVQNDWEMIAKKSNGAISFAKEVKINPTLQPKAAEWNIYSSCDGCITLCKAMYAPYLRCGLEIKTLSEKGFAKLQDIEPAHREQTTIYMATLDLPLMWVFYYNKSNSNITTSFPPYLYVFDKRLWEEVLEVRFAHIMDYAYKGILPQGTEGLYCRWCSFAWTCNPSKNRPAPVSSVGPAQNAYPQGMLGGNTWKV